MEAAYDYGTLMQGKYEDDSADLMQGMQASKSSNADEMDDQTLLSKIVKGPPIGPCENMIKYAPEYYRFLVPAETAPRCIGPNGKFMRDFKQQLQATDAKANVTIHTVRHATSESLVGKVVDYIMTIKSSPMGLRQTLHWALPRLSIDDHPDNQFDLRPVIPNHSMPLVIGRGGIVIRSIRQETQALIDISKEPLPSSDEIVVKIKHSDMYSVVEAAMSIWGHIDRDKCSKEIRAYEPYTFNPSEHKECGSWMEDAVLMLKVRGGLSGSKQMSYTNDSTYDNAYGAKRARTNDNNYVYDEETGNVGYEVTAGEDLRSETQNVGTDDERLQAIIQEGIQQGLAKGIKLGMKRGMEIASGIPSSRGHGGMGPPSLISHRGMGPPHRGLMGPRRGFGGPPRGMGGPIRGRGGPRMFGPSHGEMPPYEPYRGGKIPRGMPGSYYRKLMREMKDSS